MNLLKVFFNKESKYIIEMHRLTNKLFFFIYTGWSKKKVYDWVCSRHLIKNRFFFVIFSSCIPKHTICFKLTFFFMQQKKRYKYLKYLKNLDFKKSKKKAVKLLF